MYTNRSKGDYSPGCGGGSCAVGVPSAGLMTAGQEETFSKEIHGFDLIDND